MHKFFNRRKTILVFFIAASISIIYFLFNYFNENLLMEYLSENLWIQTLFLFLAIAGLINIFYPFTIRKELNKKDVELELNKFEENLIEDLEFKKQLEDL
ncbi:hypothetical protein GCM10022396_30130 [Flavivirga amylovorans]